MVSKTQEKGELLSVQMSVQAFAPAGERWISTEATPEPVPSLTVAVIVALPDRGEEGAFRLIDGGLLSTRLLVRLPEAATFPALSAAVARKS